MPKLLNADGLARVLENDDEVSNSEGEPLSLSQREEFYENLLLENQRLKKENDCLRRMLADQEDVPRLKILIDQLSEVVSSLTKNHMEVDLSTLPPPPPELMVPPMTMQDQPLPSLTEAGDFEDEAPLASSSFRDDRIPLADVTSPALNRTEDQFGYSTLQKPGFVRLHPEYDVYLLESKLANVRKTDPNIMVRDILTLSFSRRYMAQHSVHGTMCNAYANLRPKPQLPVDFLDALCHAVK